MNHWETKRLCDLADVTAGFAWKSACFSDNPDSGPPIIRIQNLGSNDNAVLAYYTGEVEPGYWVDEGDLLVSLSGSFKVCRWQGPKALLNQRIVVIRPGEQLDRDFAFFTISQRLGEISKAAVGIAVANASMGTVRDMEVPVPSLLEQERIVKLLDEADELRKLRAQADRRTADLIPALFYEMFGNPDTNPFGWPVTRAGDLMEACDYGTNQKANEEGRGVPVLRMGNVKTDGSLDLEELKTVELADSELAKQRLQVGDVLFNRTNSRELVGKTGVWDGRFEAVPASYFIRVRFRPNAEHPQHFTTFMNLSSMKRRLAKMARGAVGQANINSKELKSIEFPLPPVKLQCEFAARVSDIRAMQTEQVASRRRLDDLFQSMLHRAFQGEL